VRLSFLKFALTVGALFLFCEPAQAKKNGQEMTRIGNPIQDLVKTLDGHGGLWVNGISPTLSLPVTASIQEVVKQFFKSVDHGGVKDFTIVTSERVKIDASSYEAALVDTKSGQKIILMQFQKSTGWWTRMFEIADDAHHCREILRKALIQRMRRAGDASDQESLGDSRGAFTLQDFQALYETPGRERDAAIRALDLQNPQDAMPLLRQGLGNKDPLVAIKAATTLALLGSRDGIEKLKAVNTCTNSQIEFFYSKAALVLLGEAVPPELEEKRSVFRDLEEMIRRCQVIGRHAT
jgi:hypothetical protein